MGALGIKTFENDEALDWLQELEDSENTSLLKKSLSPKHLKYLEADDGIRIIAAAEIINGIANSARKGLPEEALEWITSNENLDVSKLVPEAIKMLERVLADESELMELWKENKKDFPKWKADVTELKELLSHPKQKSKKPANVAKPTSKTKVELGDIVLIPAGNNLLVPAKVLYISNYFKDVILLGIYKLKLNKCEFPEKLPEEAVLFIYSSQYPIRKNTWPKVGNRPLHEHEKEKSLRRVADEIWLEDKPLRKATDKDRSSLPKMLAWGPLAVEEEVKDLIGIQ